MALAGQLVGKVTSADQGYTLKHGLAMAYVTPEAAQDGRAVAIAGPDQTTLEAQVSTRAAYDPDGHRLRA